MANHISHSNQIAPNLNQTQLTNVNVKSSCSITLYPETLSEKSHSNLDGELTKTNTSFCKS